MPTWNLVRESFAPDPYSILLASGTYTFTGSNVVVITDNSDAATALDADPNIKYATASPGSPNPDPVTFATARIRSSDKALIDADGTRLAVGGLRRRISASPTNFYPTNTGGFAASGSNLYTNSRMRQRSAKPGRNLNIAYLTVNAPGEVAMGGDGSNFTVRASAEYPAGTFWPAYDRDGNRDITVSPNGGIGRLTVPGFEVPGGNVDWWIRTRAVSTSGGMVPYTARPNVSTEWAMGPNTLSGDYTMTNTGAPANGTGNPGYAFAPTLVSYEPYDATARGVVVIGDSITQGAGDDAQAVPYFSSNPGGWAARALSTDGSGRPSPQFSYVNLACASERAADWAGLGGKCRIQLVDDLQATDAWVAYTNDISSAIGVLQADFLSLWTKLANRGLRVTAFTIGPRSTSTDNWATLANQTASVSPQRTQANTWMLAGAPIDPTTKAAVAVGTAGALLVGQAGHPVSQVVDTNAAVESAPGSGKWAVTGSAFGYTTDGVHPSVVGHTAMGVAARAATLATLTS